MKSYRISLALLFAVLLDTVLLGTVALSPCFGKSVSQTSQPSRYELKKGQKIAYNFKIIADLPLEKITYKGPFYYDVESTNPFRLKFSGNLARRGERKPRDTGIIGLRMPEWLRAFSSGFYMPMLSSEIEIAPNGKVLKIKGNRHFPYLLGNISTLAFEQFDSSRQDAWTLKREMAVSEVSQFFHGYRGFGDLETISSGNKTESYKLLKKRGDGLIDYEKTYRFETECDEGKFILKGKGIWTFNEKLGISESLKMKYELVQEKSNVSVKIPLEVEYVRFSDEELVKLVKKEKEEEEKRKKLHEKRIAPVTQEDQEKYIQALTSGDKDKVKEALQDLSSWYKATPNEELADAIRPLTESGSSFENSMAKRALAHFCLKAKLQEAYSHTHPLDDKLRGRPIQKSTKLPKGLIVAAKKQHGPWYLPARVVQAINDQEYYVEFNFAGPFKHRKEKVVVEWSKICLAPHGVEQPNVDPAELEKLYGRENLESKKTVKSYQSVRIAKMKGFRMWTDNSSTFQVMAKYVGVDDKSVQLQREDGRKLKVPLDRLSKEDCQIVERLRSLPSNPFESNPFSDGTEN